MSRWIDEDEFAEALRARLAGFTTPFDAVTGPGRSGAVAAVYASYMTHKPFVPFGQPHPGVLLVIDTVSKTGRTIRKAERRAARLALEAVSLTIYGQSHERLHFWYERG